MPVVVLALGGSDCEALHDGWLGQPVNSLAYVAAAVYVLRSGGPALPAVALGAVGVGSVLYHGPMPASAEAVHDGSILALTAAMLVAWRRGSLARPPVSAPIVAAGAVTLNVLTRTDAPLCRPDSLLQGHAGWHVLTAVAAALWLGASTNQPEQRTGGRHRLDNR